MLLSQFGTIFQTGLDRIVRIAIKPSRVFRFFIQFCFISFNCLQRFPTLEQLIDKISAAANSSHKQSTLNTPWPSAYKNRKSASSSSKCVHTPYSVPHSPPLNTPEQVAARASFFGRTCWIISYAARTLEGQSNTTQHSMRLTHRSKLNQRGQNLVP